MTNDTFAFELALAARRRAARRRRRASQRPSPPEQEAALRALLPALEVQLQSQLAQWAAR